MLTAVKMKIILKQDDIRYDPWGTAMSAFFDVCEELYRQGEYIPFEWQFSAGAAGVGDPDTYFAKEIEGSNPDELIKFGNLMHRYTEMLRRAGRSY